MIRGRQLRLNGADRFFCHCVNCDREFSYLDASVNFHEVIMFCSDRCRREFYRKHHKKELEDIGLQT